MVECRNLISDLLGDAIGLIFVSAITICATYWAIRAINKFL